jgi:glycerol uptake facilitator-like aquaporin
VNPAAGGRLLAEFTGTGLLVAVVAGSGIAATRLTTDGTLTAMAGIPEVLQGAGRRCSDHHGLR